MSQPDSPSPEELVHERPEVKPLIDKAGAEPEKRVSQGTMKTGAGIAGGGTAKPLDVTPNPSQPKGSDEANNH